MDWSGRGPDPVTGDGRQVRVSSTVQEESQCTGGRDNGQVVDVSETEGGSQVKKHRTAVPPYKGSSITSVMTSLEEGVEGIVSFSSKEESLIKLIQ